MTTVAEITGAVKRLPKKDLARFRKWFVEYEAATWDKQFEADGRRLTVSWSGRRRRVEARERSNHQFGAVPVAEQHAAKWIVPAS